MIRIFYFSALALLILTSCNGKTKTDKIDSLAKAEAEHWEPAWPDTAAMKKQYTCVEIVTNMGRMEVALFDATPAHRDNFIALVKKGFYDNLLFHRIQKNFMIQAGDPDSRNAVKGQPLGQGNPGYTIPKEFRDTLYHYRGALAAARTSDDINPEKASSGSQFYIVSGEKFGTLELRNAIKNRAIAAFLQNPDNLSYNLRLRTYQDRGDMAAMNVLLEEIDVEVKPLIDSFYKLTPERTKQMYATWGGFPGLDQEYTIFGFLVSGYDVLDRIQSLKADPNQRPLEDVRILSARVLEK